MGCSSSSSSAKEADKTAKPVAIIKNTPPTATISEENGSNPTVIKDFGPPVFTFASSRNNNNTDDSSYKRELYELAKEMMELHLDNCFQFEKNGLLTMETATTAKLVVTPETCPWYNARMKDRLKQINVAANGLITRYQSNNPVDYTYLISKEALKNLSTLPKFEFALQNNLLLRVPIVNCTRSEFEEYLKTKVEPKGEVKYARFYSHKWDKNSPDDLENNFLRLIKQDQETKNGDYAWIDYCCVPQDNYKDKINHLYNIASVCSVMPVVSIFPNKELENLYDSSVWCQLEAIKLSKTSGLKPIKQRTFTIFDWNDVYSVLPSFLELYSGEEAAYRFFTHKVQYQSVGYVRSSVLSDLLNAFLLHY